MKRIGAVCALLSLAACNASASGPALPLAPAEAPAVVSSHGVATFALRAELDPSNGFPTFVYQGDYGYAPTLVVNPGDTIVGDLSDDLQGHGLPSDVNLHFHGLNVSPHEPADDVLTMLARPGGSLHYVVRVPASQPPGLYWYHAHVHGETNYQVGQGGMSGAIVVQGLSARLFPKAPLPEQVLVVRQLGNGAGSLRLAPQTSADAGEMVMSSPSPRPPNTQPCAHSAGDLLTVNRLNEPTLHVRSGRPAFFGIVNATGHRTLDLSVRGAAMRVVGIDGYPLDEYPGAPAQLAVPHFVLPPGGRVEFLATVRTASALQTSCYFSGPGGDADPPQLLAHVSVSESEDAGALVPAAGVALRARPQPLPRPAVSRVVRLTEDANGFYINGRAFSPRAKPTFVVHTGTVERWTVLNLTPEVHAFHLHQVHFFVESVDGVPVNRRFWRDTVVVPYGRQEGGVFKPGEVTLIADFRNPLIRGTFLFHCHILDHEDHGMMAKIQAIP
ncbi:MAG: multicopper oxidase domain-containing protein [Candidatus Eremiobacteraeota bacterium]|nr:multicopper oxidase domain-containing protein [Candidatus Eremiobacteraeota bacterium]